MTNLRSFITVLREAWRGWSDDDLASFLEKTEPSKATPGMAIPITKREARAYLAHSRKKYREIYK